MPYQIDFFFSLSLSMKFAQHFRRCILAITFAISQENWFRRALGERWLTDEVGFRNFLLFPTTRLQYIELDFDWFLFFPLIRSVSLQCSFNYVSHYFCFNKPLRPHEHTLWKIKMEFLSLSVALFSSLPSSTRVAKNTNRRYFAIKRNKNLKIPHFSYTLSSIA